MVFIWAAALDTQSSAPEQQVAEKETNIRDIDLVDPSDVAQTDSPAGETVTASNDGSYWPALIIGIIVFFIIRRLVNRSRTSGEARLPSHEELRRLRDVRLSSTYASTSTPASKAEPKRQERKDEPAKAEVTPAAKKPARPRRHVISLPPRAWVPIKSFQELLNWDSSTIPSRSSTFRLKESASPKRILLCHDMAGNYAEDAFEDGWYAHRQPDGCWVWGFRPAHFVWSDVFIYFSHNFVTIPPGGWISAAHQHGCKVLGTFLTEWEAGEAICAEIFASRDTTLNAADKLVEIAQKCGFDGWLVNIENQLTLEMVENMKLFLERLSLAEQRMEIIWYDSVLPRTGQLRWQNGLNSENVDFFLRANAGILTNYGWGEQKLETSRETALAFNRSPDLIWHGIDVFGRGTMGGGGMSCDLALNVIDRFEGNSACLFAPGWTLEVAAERDGNKGRAQGLMFFHKLLHNTPWGESMRSVKYDLTTEGLFTDFCDGGGATCYIQGERVSSFPWLDLRRQRLQPRWDILTPDECEDAVAQRRITIRCLDTGPAFSGSNCIHLVGRRTGLTSEDWCFFPILGLTSRLGGTKGPASTLKVTAAFLSLHGDAALGLHIAARESDKPVSRLVLVPSKFEKENVLPAITEYMVRGWTIRTWELRTYDLRGRNLVGVSASPLPMETGSTSATWVDIRVGFVSLHEMDVDISACSPVNASLDKTTLLVRWECACAKVDRSCCLDHIVLLVNGKFRQMSTSRGPTQLGELSFTPLGLLEDSITLKACRVDGSWTNECPVELK